MKRVILIISLFLSAPIMNLSAHYLLFTPQNSNPGDDPYKFLLFIKDAVTLYIENKKKTPDNWESLWPYMEKRATGNIVLTKDAYHRKGHILITDALIDKKSIQYRYIINPGKNWSVFTENSGGTDNWILVPGRETAYRFFKDESAEIAMINAMAGKLKVKKIGGVALTTGFQRSRILSNWKFRHAAAFDALLPYLSDTEETCWFRIEVAKAILDTPELQRFKHRLPAIDEIINRELKLKPEDDHYRTGLIETLKELKKSIQTGH